MKNIGKIIASILLIFVLLFNTVSCDVLLGAGGNDIIGDNSGNNNDEQQTEEKQFYINGSATIDMNVGDVMLLYLVTELDGDVIWTSSSSCASVTNGIVTALDEGQAVIKAAIGSVCDYVTVNISAAEDSDDDTPSTENPDDSEDKLPENPDPNEPNQGDSDSDDEDVKIPDKEDPITSDPYVNVDVDQFYANYTPAISYMDAYYRSKHNLMSGSIADQDQAPTISAYQPKSGGMLIRNSVCLYSEDGNTYYVVDCYGEIAFEIYKGGAYVILEEVAAYVYAFGEPPVNQTSSKSTSPSSSPWGKYLRLNHSAFSGDTSRYPYEPALPDISGCGGSLRYYEMDIGTTGTDCDPSYTATIYNNGSKITRGAARIVYTYQDKNRNGTIEYNERYVFYTYNHYNDFQEYLNYEGGWGEMFGNITGGGVISSKNNYNPTPYVRVAYESLKTAKVINVVYYYVSKNEIAA